MTVLRRSIAVALLLPLLVVAGCKYHSLIIMEHDYKAAVSAFQQAEMNEFKAGNIDVQTHQQLEGIVLKLAQGGQQVAVLLRGNASKQTIIQQVSAIDSSLQDALSNGLLGVKNPTAQQNFRIMLISIQDILNNFSTALGAPAPVQ